MDGDCLCCVFLVYDYDISSAFCSLKSYGEPIDDEFYRYVCPKEVFEL